LFLEIPPRVEYELTSLGKSLLRPLQGLVDWVYGPSKVSALVADCVPVELTSRTDYPFGEAIEIAVKPARRATFPFFLRIPGWCKNPRLAVNDTAVKAAPDAHGFVRVERRWKSGDRIRLQFPTSTRVTIGRDANPGGAPYAAVYYGPPVLRVADCGYDRRKTPDPAARWKYALDTAIRLIADKPK
jgi:DUF1680 family protein